MKDTTFAWSYACVCWCGAPCCMRVHRACRSSYNGWLQAKGIASFVSIVSINHGYKILETCPCNTLTAFTIGHQAMPHLDYFGTDVDSCLIMVHNQLSALPTSQA